VATVRTTVWSGTVETGSRRRRTRVAASFAAIGAAMVSPVVSDVVVEAV